MSSTVIVDKIDAYEIVDIILLAAKSDGKLYYLYLPDIQHEAIKDSILNQVGLKIAADHVDNIRYIK